MSLIGRIGAARTGCSVEVEDDPEVEVAADDEASAGFVDTAVDVADGLVASVPPTAVVVAEVEVSSSDIVLVGVEVGVGVVDVDAGVGDWASVEVCVGAGGAAGGVLVSFATEVVVIVSVESANAVLMKYANGSRIARLEVPLAEVEVPTPFTLLVAVDVGAENMFSEAEDVAGRPVMFQTSVSPTLLISPSV